MSSARAETEGTIVMSGWAQQQRNPAKHLTGLIAVTAVHGLALWLVMSGLGQKIVKAVAPKSIVEVILPEPPPPPPKPPEPPKQQPKLETPPPPPTYVPPSEVPVEAPPTAPVIVASPTPPPPQQVYVPAPPAPPAPPKPTARGFGSITNKPACREALVASFPRDARRNSQEGSVRLAVRVGTDGKVLNVDVVNSNPRRIFDRAATGVFTSGVCQFEKDTEPYTAYLDVEYKLSGETSE